MLVSNVREFEKEIARLNKKAARIGVPQIVARQLGRRTVTRLVVTECEGDVSERSVPVDVVEYDVTLPQVEDRKWQLCATITPMEGEDKAFIDPHVKGFDTEPWKKVDPCKCDHCHARRIRNLTYVVRHKEEGKFMQLGRSCFADYIGTKALEQMEFCATLFQSFGGGDEDFIFPHGPGRVEVVELRYVIAVAEAIAAHDGWKNNVKDEYTGHLVQEGTHRQAANYIRKRRNDFSAAALEHIAQLGKDKDAVDPIWAQVDAAIARVQDLEAGADDFAAALKNISEFKVIPVKKASLAAYLCQFLRNMDRRAAFEAKKAKMQYVGTVGKREVFKDLTLRKVVFIESMWGSSYLHIFEDANGNELTWKTNALYGQQNEKMTVKATVKEHKEYNGAPQTKLSRATVVSRAGIASESTK